MGINIATQLSILFLISIRCSEMNLSHKNLTAYKCGPVLIGFISELLFTLISMTAAKNELWHCSILGKSGYSDIFNLL